MRVIVRTVSIASKWDGGTLVDQPDFREVTFRLLDHFGTGGAGLAVPIESTITLPANDAYTPGNVFDVTLTRTQTS